MHPNACIEYLFGMCVLLKCLVAYSNDMCIMILLNYVSMLIEMLKPLPYSVVLIG